MPDASEVSLGVAVQPANEMFPLRLVEKPREAGRCCRRSVASDRRINSTVPASVGKRNESWACMRDFRPIIRLSSTALLAVTLLLATGCAREHYENRTSETSRGKPAAEAPQRAASAEPAPAAAVRSHRYKRKKIIRPRTATPYVRVEPRIPASPSAPPPVPPPERRQPSLPVVTPPRPPVDAAPQPPVPSPTVPQPAPTSPAQPRIINPSTPPAQPAPPAQPPVGPPADPLPTQPGPPPPREDPVPAPPNRANVTPPRHSGGGIVAARPGAAPHQPPAAGNAINTALPQPAPNFDGLKPETASVARLEHARRLLERGKVIEARMTIQSILNTAPAAALHELGRTYDPYYLSQLPRIDDGSEPRRAATLYQQAIAHGASAAVHDLDRIRAGHPGLR